MTRPPFLSVDLGNSRCKACLFPAGGGAPAPLFDVPTAEARAAVGGAAFGALPPQTTAALSCVATAELGRALLAALEALASPVHFNPECGLTLEVEHPETVGHDRLYAARGALECSPEPAVVVDAGSALTVDAVRPEPAAAGSVGRFLGGAIAPGPDALAEALARGGAGLWSVEPRLGAPALGKDTTAALVAGVSVGFVGAAERLVREVAREAGLERPALFLTGGRRGFLLEALSLEARSAASGGLREVGHLVHLGLEAAARGADPEAGSAGKRAGGGGDAP